MDFRLERRRELSLHRVEWPAMNLEEVEYIFSAKLEDFLHYHDGPSAEAYGSSSAMRYHGAWYDRHSRPYRMHHFHVLFREETPQGLSVGLREVESINSRQHEDVFGMTARIIVDTARCAYDRPPQFTHNGHFGDEVLIKARFNLGKGGPGPSVQGMIPDALKQASKL